MSTRLNLLVNRSSIGETTVHTSEVGELAARSVRLEIEKFALTANNITYAQFGDMLAYWDFFPVAADRAPDAGAADNASDVGAGDDASDVGAGDDASDAGATHWGNVPAMGWAKVTQSNVDQIAVGSRYYGWFPMASSVDMVATPTSTGFRDDGAHRAAHAPVYRMFVRTDLDPNYTVADDEERHALIRGLFLTGYLIDAFLNASNYYGAEQAIVMSASSKTAIAFAQSAHGRRPVRLIGVTSPSNREFVEQLGCYDEVVTYDALEVAAVPSVIVDMSGAGAAVAELHAHLGDLITYSMIVGKSHHEAPPVALVGGPQPEMFFAPTAMSVIAEQGDSAADELKDALAKFLTDSRRWLSVEPRVGAAQVSAAWAELYAGTVAPSVGVIASLAS
jgi:hypothetical protein